MVRVIATAIGYHNGYREIGDEFDAPFPQSTWWKPVHPSMLKENQPTVRRGRPPLNKSESNVIPKIEVEVYDHNGEQISDEIEDGYGFEEKPQDMDRNVI